MNLNVKQRRDVRRGIVRMRYGRVCVVGGRDARVIKGSVELAFRITEAKEPLRDGAPQEDLFRRAMMLNEGDVAELEEADRLAWEAVSSRVVALTPAISPTMRHAASERYGEGSGGECAP